MTDTYIIILLLSVLAALGIAFLAVLIRSERHEQSGGKDELQHFNEDMSLLMVHELRAPLISLRWLMEDLMDSKKLTVEKTREELGVMHHSVNEMLLLINNMLDTGKMTYGTFEIVPKTCNLPDILKTAVAEIEPLANQKNLKMKTEFDPHLPAGFCDEIRVLQVVNNFLSNAVKFTDKGGVTVRAVHDSNKRVIRISVEDTGIGIPEKEQKKLFQRYIQVGKTKDREKGTGLGLVIAKGIVEAHGGTVGVASKEGKGSTFWFTIPEDTSSGDKT